MYWWRAPIDGALAYHFRAQLMFETHIGEKLLADATREAERHLKGECFSWYLSNFSQVAGTAGLRKNRKTFARGWGVKQYTTAPRKHASSEVAPWRERC